MILGDLPEWFGIEEANQGYIDGLSDLPSAVAVKDGQIIGFISIRSHYDRSAEVEVMGVDRAQHRNGAGAALIDWAVAWCRAENVPWLHVKTRGPATPDPDYERTRQFYLAAGFDPLFESTTLWGPSDAALILIRKIDGVN